MSGEFHLIPYLSKVHGPFERIPLAGAWLADINIFLYAVTSQPFTFPINASLRACYGEGFLWAAENAKTKAWDNARKSAHEADYCMINVTIGRCSQPQFLMNRNPNSMVPNSDSNCCWRRSANLLTKVGKSADEGRQICWRRSADLLTKVGKAFSCLSRRFSRKK